MDKDQVAGKFDQVAGKAKEVGQCGGQRQARQSGCCRPGEGCGERNMGQRQRRCARAHDDHAANAWDDRDDLKTARKSDQKHVRASPAQLSGIENPVNEKMDNFEDWERDKRSLKDSKPLIHIVMTKACQSRQAFSCLLASVAKRYRRGDKSKEHD